MAVRTRSRTRRPGFEDLESRKLLSDTPPTYSASPPPPAQAAPPPTYWGNSWNPANWGIVGAVSSAADTVTSTVSDVANTVVTVAEGAAQGLAQGASDLAEGAANTVVQLGYTASDLAYIYATDSSELDPSQFSSALFQGAAQSGLQGQEAARNFDNQLVYGIATLGVGPLAESGYNAVVTGDSTRFSQQAGGFAISVLVPYAAGEAFAALRPLAAVGDAAEAGAGAMGEGGAAVGDVAAATAGESGGSGLIAGSEGTFGPGRIPVDLPVTTQPTSNTCVPSCVDMLLESYAPGRGATVIDSLQLRPGGMVSSDMVGFLIDNLEPIGMDIARGSVADALQSGEPFIAIVDNGHAVLIDGAVDVGGRPYLIVRDPAVGAYMERLDWFLDQRVVLDQDVLGYPTIWAVR